MAVSDPTKTIARPLTVISHVSRASDAQAIARLAEEHEAELILVGIPLDQDGQHGPQARKSQRLAQAIQDHIQIQVILWDESGSSRAAGPDDQMHDARAAAVILQDYLDAQDAK